MSEKLSPGEYLKERMEVTRVPPEQLLKDGWTPEKIAKLVSSEEDNEGLMKTIKEHFPELTASKHPADVMKVYDFFNHVRAWLRRGAEFHAFLTYLSDQCAVRLAGRLRAMRERQDALDKKNEKAFEGANAEIQSLRHDLQVAAARNGVYGTQDKHELENARKQIEDLKAQILGMQETMKGQMGVIRTQEARLTETETNARAALRHAKEAQERLEDRYATPGPFFEGIIDELRNAVKLMPV